MSPPEHTAAIPGAEGSRHSSAPNRASPLTGSWLRKLLGFTGPGYLIAVGYMDPGNWATDLAAGSSFGYSLLWIILLVSGTPQVGTKPDPAAPTAAQVAAAIDTRG